MCQDSYRIADGVMSASEWTMEGALERVGDDAWRSRDVQISEALDRCAQHRSFTVHSLCGGTPTPAAYSATARRPTRTAQGAYA